MRGRWLHCCIHTQAGSYSRGGDACNFTSILHRGGDRVAGGIEVVSIIFYHVFADRSECIQAFSIEIGIPVVVPSDGYKGMGHSPVHKLG